MPSAGPSMNAAVASVSHHRAGCDNGHAGDAGWRRAGPWIDDMVLAVHTCDGSFVVARRANRLSDTRTASDQLSVDAGWRIPMDHGFPSGLRPLA
jgi:hypothetical protein